MRSKFYLFLFFTFSASVGYSQKNTTEIAVPDSIKKICDKLFVSEIGKAQFLTCVKFKKSSGAKITFGNNEKRLDFKLDYVFSYPTVKEAAVPLTFIYSVFNGKGKVQSGSFLRFGKTDLPPNTKTDGLKIINYKAALAIALETDSIMKKHINKVEGKFVLYYDSFCWHFGYSYPDPNPKSENEDRNIEHHVTIDPFSGKVKAAYKQ